MRGLIFIACLIPHMAVPQEWAADFRTQVAQCWNLAGVEEPKAVTVRFGLMPDGRVAPDKITPVDEAADAASPSFQAARRAIMRCGRDGFDLPTDQYETWRVVEMTFDPNRMGVE